MHSFPPLAISNGKISWFVYVVQLSDGYGATGRDRIVEKMKSLGIGMGRYFAPVHLQPIYRSSLTSSTSLPVTETVAARSIALPFFNRIEDVQIKDVCDVFGATVSSR